MQFGVMLRSQFPGSDDPQIRFEEVLSQARLADELGYDSVTKGMHYGSAPLLDFNQLTFLSRLTGEVKRARLNAGIVLLSLHKPLDIAEQIATMDVMSGGRMIFGCALGYREVEFNAFGTTQKERVPRMEENLIAIKRLWTEEKVTMQGSHFELKEVTAGMRPVQDPHPPIWMGANANPAIKRAARFADCWYIPPHNRVDTIMEQLDFYRAELDEADRPFPTELPMRREVFVAPTREDALRLCGPSLALKYKTYHQWGQSKPMPEGDNDLGQELHDLMKNRFFIGSPDEVADDIIAMCRPTGVNHIIISTHWPGMENEVALDSMRMFAEEVMPRVRQGM